jgi:hypothetical protein
MERSIEHAGDEALRHCFVECVSSAGPAQVFDVLAVVMKAGTEPERAKESELIGSFLG